MAPPEMPGAIDPTPTLNEGIPSVTDIATGHALACEADTNLDDIPAHEEIPRVQGRAEGGVRAQPPVAEPAGGAHHHED